MTALLGAFSLKMAPTMPNWKAFLTQLLDFVTPAIQHDKLKIRIEQTAIESGRILIAIDHQASAFLAVTRCHFLQRNETPFVLEHGKPAFLKNSSKLFIKLFQLLIEGAVFNFFCCLL
ncbi:MAG: hypothetical protein R3F37_00520 [Candidatus Competibacteraceae bacterium]